MLRRVAETILRYSMIPQGSRVGVAVSGGADSVALLCLLNELSAGLNLELVVLHLNHCLRGEASDEDARFVAELAETMGWGSVIHTEAVADCGGNLEQAGRQARYRFFALQMRELGLSRVATGHTRDDQAETVLFRILRGTGPPGLAGILPVTKEGIVRPLLFHTRQELRRYLTDGEIQWREDASNRDPRFSRTRIRQDLLPALERDWGPGVAQRLARLAEAAGPEESYWRGRVERELVSLSWESEYGVIVDLERLSRAPEALIRRLLRTVASRAGGGSLNASHTAALVRMTAGESAAARLELPSLVVERSVGYLRMVAAAAPETVAPFEFEVPQPLCVIRLPMSEIRLFPVALQQFESVCCSGFGESCIYFVGSGSLRFPLVLRSWRPGDRFQLWGTGQEVPLVELFKCAGIPSWERSLWPIIIQGDRVVWSRLFGAAPSYAASGSPAEVVQIEESLRKSAHVGKSNVRRTTSVE